MGAHGGKMAVKVNNTASIRKAKRWTERDDAALCVLLKKKIKDVNVALRECDSPYVRARLKEQKRHYKTMLVKVENGCYNGDIIFSELQASAALASAENVRTGVYSTNTGARRYNSSYENMDFDYETAFRKKRYYGFGLPLFMLILSIVFVAIFVVSAFLPADVMDTLADNGLAINSLFSYKLGPDTLDIEIANVAPDEENGIYMVWPSGTFAKGYDRPEQGTQWVDDKGNAPDTVRLYEDLGMTSVYISPFDIVKAWFHTPMLEKTRLDFLENNALFQGTSYYNLCFLYGSKGDSLTIEKDENGDLDRSVIFRHVGTYGAIMALIAAFLLGVLNIIINFVRLFTYTSRRLHFVSFFSLLISVFLFICPALATVEGTDIGTSFSSYLSALTDGKGFMANAEATVGIGILILLPIIISLIQTILPLFFKNRLKKRPTYVPAGNKGRSALDDPMYSQEDILKRLV